MLPRQKMLWKSEKSIWGKFIYCDGASVRLLLTVSKEYFIKCAGIQVQ